VISHDLLLCFFLGGKGGGGGVAKGTRGKGGSSMTCSFLHDHMRF
jgi:hypothetical protein